MSTLFFFPNPCCVLVLWPTYCIVIFCFAFKFKIINFSSNRFKSKLELEPYPRGLVRVLPFIGTETISSGMVVKPIYFGVIDIV